MKKLTLLLLILLLAFACDVFVVAEEPAETPVPEKYTSGDYEYIILEDGTAEIVKFKGRAEELTIPEELDGMEITSIGDEAFYACRSLTSVMIPDSVISIGEDAFTVYQDGSNIPIPSLIVTVPRDSYAA